MELLFGILVFIGIGLYTLWDRENIDKSSVSLGGGDYETVRLNNERKREQRAKLEEKVRKLNAENPGRSFYRDGPRIKERTPEEIRKADSVQAEYDRLNAPYATYQPHYKIKNGELVHVGEHVVRIYKYEEKMRKINRDFENGIDCRFDPHAMKLMNTITGEEIPFNPDEYTLTGRVV